MYIWVMQKSSVNKWCLRPLRILYSLNVIRIRWKNLVKRLFGLRNRSLVSLLIKEKSIRVHFLHPFHLWPRLVFIHYHVPIYGNILFTLLLLFRRTITADYGYFLLISMATFYSLCFFFLQDYHRWLWLLRPHRLQGLLPYRAGQQRRQLRLRLSWGFSNQHQLFKNKQQKHKEI